MYFAIQNIINRTLHAFKMPIALASLFVLPALVMTYAQYFRHYWHLHEGNIYFLGGFAGMALLWAVALMGHNSPFKTLEHEITHALFGYLTFNPPREIVLHDNGGGYMRFSGEANWLMCLSPYFFPLLAWMMIGLGWLVNAATGETPLWVFGAIGAGMGYNVFSNIDQIHPGQTDFSRAGMEFSVFFLPSANLFSYGWILSFINGGGDGIDRFLNLIQENIIRYADYF